MPAPSLAGLAAGPSMSIVRPPSEGGSAPSRRPARQGIAAAAPRGFPACGEMAEWSKAHAWKVCRRVTVSRVRIPFSPPSSLLILLVNLAGTLFQRHVRGLAPNNIQTTAPWGCDFATFESRIWPLSQSAICVVLLSSGRTNGLGGKPYFIGQSSGRACRQNGEYPVVSGSETSQMLSSLPIVGAPSSHACGCIFPSSRLACEQARSSNLNVVCSRVMFSSLPKKR